VITGERGKPTRSAVPLEDSSLRLLERTGEGIG
jgi:hypothetical protein